MKLHHVHKIWGWTSYITVICLLVFAMNLWSQKPLPAPMTVTSVSLTYGSMSRWGFTVDLPKEVERAVITTWVENNRGSRIYSYPSLETNASVSYVLPNLGPGSYTVKASIVYPLNPVKTVTQDIVLAHVKVSQDGNTHSI